MSKIYLVQKIVSRLIASIFKKVAKTNCQKKQTRLPIQECVLAGYRYHRADGIWPFLQVGEALRLKREPQNHYDPHAIAVYFKNDMLGYIPRSENRLLAQMMDQGERLEAVITELLSGPKAGRCVKCHIFLGTKRLTYSPNTLQIQWK